MAARKSSSGRRYARDSKGRFASTGSSGGGKAKKSRVRKSDLAFQKSGKGGGKSVKAGRAAKAAYKKKEGARRLSNLKSRDKYASAYTGGSQRRKQGRAKVAAEGTGYKRKRSPNKPVSAAVKAQRKAAAQAKSDAAVNEYLKTMQAFHAKHFPAKKRRRSKK